MMKDDVSLVITDLDNTLYDWVEQWYFSFRAMLDKIIEISGVDEDKLISEIKSIHQKHGTSEYAFLIEEIPSLQGGTGSSDLLEKYDDAIHAYRSARKQHLKLFPKTIETLKVLKSKGVKIVGYTESMAFYSSYRVKKLGLDGLLDMLFSPKDHDLPKGLNLDQLRMYPDDHYKFQSTKHEHTPEGELKPNPNLLQDILLLAGGSKANSIYIGDNLHKDIKMAQDCGVADVYAEFGSAHKRPEYRLLIDVTHWTDDDVEREQDLSKHDVNPSYVLHKDISELLEMFEFTQFQK